MKATVVPAQITSKEDTISGNLTLTQVAILVIPVFLSAFIVAGLPPFMHLRQYKITLMVLFGLPVLALALRVRGQIIFKWIFLLSSYAIRPRYYLAAVKDIHFCRCNEVSTFEIEEIVPEAKSEDSLPLDELKPDEFVELNQLLAGKQLNVLADEKGRLNAVFKTL